MVTTLQTPDKFRPAYNEIPYVVSSDKTAESNFKYVCDIYITGVSSPAYIRRRLHADPTTGFAVFDAHRIVENFLSSDINTSLYGWQTNDNSYVEYQCKFGEEFGSSSSGTTVYSNQVTVSAKYAFNGVFDFLDFHDYTQTPYVIAGTSSTNKFLTNQPSTVYIRDDQNAWLHAMTDTSGSIYYAQVNTYNSAGDLIQTCDIINSYQAAASNASKFVRVGIGTRNLNSIPGASIVNGSQPIITASVAKYNVCITKFNGDETSEIKTYVINNECTKNDVFRIHFLNKLGGFDSFSFIRTSRTVSNVRRELYKKNLGNLTAITGAYSYNKSDRQDTIFDTNIKDRVSVQSDWLTDSESTWLEELITSPAVFLDHATHGLIAINITDSAYEIRRSVNDKVFNLLVNFEYTYNRKRQRG